MPWNQKKKYIFAHLTLSLFKKNKKKMSFPSLATYAVLYHDVDPQYPNMAVEVFGDKFDHDEIMRRPYMLGRPEGSTSRRPGKFQWKDLILHLHHAMTPTTFNRLRSHLSKGGLLDRVRYLHLMLPEDPTDASNMLDAVFFSFFNTPIFGSHIVSVILTAPNPRYPTVSSILDYAPAADFCRRLHAATQRPEEKENMIQCAYRNYVDSFPPVPAFPMHENAACCSVHIF